MNRLTVVAVAAVIALGSGLGLMRYVGGAEDRAATTVERVAVLMAAADVETGTSFDEAWADGSIVTTETLRASLPATAITDPAALRGTVTDGGLRAGQLVVEGTFAEADEVGRVAGPRTFADDLPDGTVAVSFDAGGAAAVSDLISPGDRVNLLVQVPNAAELGLPDSAGPAIVHVFQDLRVVAIGAALVPPPDAAEAPVAPGGGSYTVAVAPRDAARLLLLTRQYEVFLVLVGPGTEPSEQPPLGKADALPEQLTADVAAEVDG